MATSPAPDAAAPPGMCPGIAVLGGGGGSGDGDGDGNGGSDGSGGDGDGNSKGGNGDGKSGAGCGKGGAGGCPNCGHSVAGGDPVNLATGEMFTFPHADLQSPGFVDLVFLRRYTTLRAALDIGLGFGWAHSFAWRFKRKRRTIVVEKGIGAAPIEFAVPGAGEPSRVGDWTLRGAGDDYVLVTSDDFAHTFSPAASRADRYLLTRVRHANGHGFDLEYNGAGKLATITDSAGRRIMVENNREGRVASLSITDPRTGYTIVFARYEYDDRGDLVRVTNADGFVHTFAYDEEHRMVRQTYPDGPTFYYVYDRKGRCIESWGDAGGKPDPALAADLPATLEDGRTRAKGFAHIRLEFSNDGYVEYSDSMRFWRLFVDAAGNVTKAVVGTSVTEHIFDDRGHVASRTDPVGAMFTYKHDERGNLVEETDPLGHTAYIDRDERGRIVKNRDELGKEIQCVRDPRGNVIAVTNQRSATTTYTLDEHGNMVQRTDAIGGVTRYADDEMGNLRTIIQPNGGTWSFDYDYFGRLIRRTDPLGRLVYYAYSDAGLMLRARQEDLFLEYTYNGLGCITQVTAPEGTYQIRWSGFYWPYERIEPNGDRIRAEYNREGWVVRHFNEAGEVYSFEYDRSGMITRATRFDGSRIETKYDAAHRASKIGVSTGEAAYITRDIVGRITAIEYTDGRTVQMAYDDVSGEPSRVVTPEGTFRFDYDAVGNVVAEHQTIDGETHWVAASYDLGDHLVGLTTSLGHTVQIQRDRQGERRRVLLDNAAMVSYDRNLVGLEVALNLHGGARIETEYDGRYRVARRRVRGQGGRALVPEGHPDWVGPDDAGIVMDRSYRFSASDHLVEVADRDAGVTTYDYDARGRLTAKVPANGRAERFACDATYNLYERGPDAKVREYGPGNLLLRHGNVHYGYDANDRLIEKREGDGGAARAWKYRWNAEHQLTTVETPEGLRISFAYDSFARRIKKTVARKSEANAYELVKQTRYVWFGPSLLHEITTTPGGERSVRTYAHTDRRVQPWAHRDEGSGGAAPSEWIYYVGDILNTPERLIRGDGRVVGELTRSAFGVTRKTSDSSITTAVRFAGQYEDEETGLHYNLHRYYDPETGRYIRADPVGLLAGENHFVYCNANPITYVDTTGLDGHDAKCELDIKNGGKQNGTWVPYSDPATPQNPSAGVLKSGHTEDGIVHDIPGAKNKATGKTINTKGEIGKTGNTTQPSAHTEQHATEWAEKNFPGRLEESHMKLKGNLPPCQICNDKMHKFAKDNNATVDYSYPEKNKLRYEGGKGPTDIGRTSSKDGGKSKELAGDLASAYQNRNSLKDDNQSIKGQSGYREYMIAKGTWKK